MAGTRRRRGEPTVGRQVGDDDELQHAFRDEARETLHNLQGYWVRLDHQADDHEAATQCARLLHLLKRRGRGGRRAMRSRAAPASSTRGSKPRARTGLTADVVAGARPADRGSRRSTRWERGRALPRAAPAPRPRRPATTTSLARSFSTRRGERSTSCGSSCARSRRPRGSHAASRPRAPSGCSTGCRGSALIVDEAPIAELATRGQALCEALDGIDPAALEALVRPARRRRSGNRVRRRRPASAGTAAVLAAAGGGMGRLPRGVERAARRPRSLARQARAERRSRPPSCRRCSGCTTRSREPRTRSGSSRSASSCTSSRAAVERIVAAPALPELRAAGHGAGERARRDARQHRAGLGPRLARRRPRCHQRAAGGDRRTQLVDRGLVDRGQRSGVGGAAVGRPGRWRRLASSRSHDVARLAPRMRRAMSSAGATLESSATDERGRAPTGGLSASRPTGSTGCSTSSASSSWRGRASSPGSGGCRASTDEDQHRHDAVVKQIDDFVTSTEFADLDGHRVRLAGGAGGAARRARRCGVRDAPARPLRGDPRAVAAARRRRQRHQRDAPRDRRRDAAADRGRRGAQRDRHASSRPRSRRRGCSRSRPCSPGSSCRSGMQRSAWGARSRSSPAASTSRSTRRSRMRCSGRCSTSCATRWSTASRRRRVAASSASRARAALSLVARQEQGQVVLEVTDDGQGIDVARLKAIGVERGLDRSRDARDRSARARSRVRARREHLRRGRRCGRARRRRQRDSPRGRSAERLDRDRDPPRRGYDVPDRASAVDVDHPGADRAHRRRDARDPARVRRDHRPARRRSRRSIRSAACG